jgi:hypothetical protein
MSVVTSGESPGFKLPHGKDRNKKRTFQSRPLVAGVLEFQELQEAVGKRHPGLEFEREGL